jgi:hypothetical protein
MAATWHRGVSLDEAKEGPRAGIAAALTATKGPAARGAAFLSIEQPAQTSRTHFSGGNRRRRRAVPKGRAMRKPPRAFVGRRVSCSWSARPPSTDAVVVGATRTASKVRPRRQVARRRRQGNRRPPVGWLLLRRRETCVAGVQPAGAPDAAGTGPRSRLTVTDAACRRGSGVE